MPCNEPVINARYMRRYQIMLNIKKCMFLIHFGNLLGHVVFKQGLMVDPTKIAVILNVEAPRNVKQLCATLGHTGYCRKFIKSYSQILETMEKSLKKDVTFYWDDDCKKEFLVHVNASCIALGVVLI